MPKTEQEREYELILVLNNEKRDQLDSIKSEIEAGLSKRKASVSRKDDWGHRKLFHSPNKIEEGNFYYVRMRTMPSSIQQINNDLRVNQNVIKSMVSVLN